MCEYGIQNGEENVIIRLVTESNELEKADLWQYKIVEESQNETTVIVDIEFK